MTTNSQISIGHFLFTEFAEIDSYVRCSVQYVRGFREDMNEAREEEVKSLLQHMGKWESLLRFLNDSGLSDKNPRTQKSGRGLYDVTTQLNKGNQRVDLWVKFSITKEDSLLRTNRKDTIAKLTIPEIVEQLENINRWKNFQTLIRASKEIFSTAD